MSKRAWGEWPGRFMRESNSANGVFGITGVALGGVGIALASPVAAATAFLVSASMFGWCLIRAIPPLKLQANEHLGQVFDDIDDIEKIDPPLPCIGFVGVSRSGKTTLLSRVIADVAQPVRTEEPYFVITNVPGDIDHLFILMDAAGQQFSQQFKVLDKADYIVALIDSSASEISRDIDRVRLNQHEQLLQQFEGYLRRSPRRPKALHLLLNKRDLWEGESGETRFRQWVDSQEARWRTIPEIEFSFDTHSNFKAEDTPKIIQKIRDWT